MRLTRKKDNKYFVHKLDLDDFKDCAGESVMNTIAVINKLGQLEDIEEELGIDLATLIQALKNGIYTKIYKNYVFGDELTIELGNGFSFKEYDCSIIAYFKDYGKTWALTKEELL